MLSFVSEQDIYMILPKGRQVVSSLDRLVVKVNRSKDDSQSLLSFILLSSHSFLFPSRRSFIITFLVRKQHDNSKHASLYEVVSLRPSVDRPSIGSSVRRSVGPPVRPSPVIFAGQTCQLITGHSKKSVSLSRPRREVRFFAWCSACLK